MAAVGDQLAFVLPQFAVVRVRSRSPVSLPRFCVAVGIVRSRGTDQRVISAE